MAKQTFTSIERQAIWMAHGKKCAYTGEVLDLRNMHIDHILPEWLADDPEAFEAIKTQYKLPADFNLRGVENLLPCTQSANLQKRTAVFDEPKTMYFLGIASSKKEEIKKHISEIKTEIDKGKAAVFLKSLLDEGKITVEEVADMLGKYKSSSDDVFTLIEGLSFVDKAEVKRIKKADISDLRKLKVKMGPNIDIEGAELTHENGERILVTTCLEYDEAISNGYYSRTTFDMKMATYFEHQCGLLKSLENAKIPETSFISDPRVGIVDLHLMPFKMFFEFEKKEADQMPGITYQDKINEGRLKIKQLKNNLLRIESRTMGQQLIEVARADFNGDGIEDILLYSYGYAIGGTLGGGGITIITRKSQEGLFEEIQ